MIDPRHAAIRKRLAEVGRILAVTGGKGGIGKSVIASTLATELAESGRRTGLLDLDLTAPTDHVVLGLDDRFPTEEFGLEPPVFEGVRFMSVSYFVGSRPVSLRGDDVTNAVLEILAVTRWGPLDVVVIDMPPGLGDATLDAVRLMRGAEYVVVGTAARVVRETVRRTITLLTELGVPVAGVVENMARGDSPAVRELAADFGLRFLGTLPWDEELERAIGSVQRLRATPFAAAVRKVRNALFEEPSC